MAKYIVLVIGLLVKSNTVKKYGDVVDGDELIRPASDLIDEGFIKKATKADLTEEEKAEQDAETERKAKEKQDQEDLEAKQKLEAEELAEKQRLETEQADADAEAEKQRLAAESTTPKLDPLKNIKK